MKNLKLGEGDYPNVSAFYSWKISVMCGETHHLYIFPEKGQRFGIIVSATQ